MENVGRERDRETAQRWQRGGGRGRSYLLGTFVTTGNWVGGLGINLLHFGEDGGGPLTTTINISPIHLCQFSKDGSNFS